MRKELDYFHIENALGWNQEWFQDWSMYDGGCAAVTACDLCIYLAGKKELYSLYPFDICHLNRKDYLAFSKIMKPYLHPRWQGIDTLELYISGLWAYWHDIGLSFLKVDGIPGTVSWKEARKQIKERIDNGMIVPFLLLYHKSRFLNDFQWHWFNLAGYEEFDEEFYVKAVQAAPNWINLQHVSIIAVKEPERRKKFAELCGGQQHIAEAPVFLIFCADFYRTWLALL